MAGLPHNTYANVTIPSSGLTYSTGTTAIWAAPTQAKVKITEEDIEIKGKSLAKVLETLEERLVILNPNPELEKQFEQLAELRKQYIALENELKEKVKSWNILKKPDQ